MKKLSTILIVLGVLLGIFALLYGPKLLYRYYKKTGVMDKMLKDRFPMSPPPKDGIQYIITVDTVGARAELLELMRNRIDEFGVAKPSIFLYGNDKVILQLPAFKDEERGLAIINRVPSFELRLIDSLPDSGNAIPVGETVITSKDIESVSPQYPSNAKPYVLIKLNGVAKERFSQVTADNIGKRIAIILDGQLITAPTVRERIPDGRVMITGSFTVENVQALTAIIKAGSSPLSYKVESKRP